MPTQFQGAARELAKRTEAAKAMAAQDDPFNQPFRLLDPLDFPPYPERAAVPAKEPQRVETEEPASRAHAFKALAVSEEDKRDRELFFSAVRKFSQSAPQRRTGGFCMGDFFSLPAVEKSVKNKEQSEKAPTPIATDIQAADSGEGDLFLKAAAGASPLSGAGRAMPRKPSLGAPPALGQMSLQDFMEGRLEFAISNTDEYFEGRVVGLDELTMNKLRQGEFSPEAHLDLHGLNSLQAFEALRQFFRSAWYKSLRCVLLVPGRGRNSPAGLGVLRGKLQIWLVQEPFKRLVLAFCTAQPHDGGPGSVYVLLRKFRKKGRIYWDRMPADADLY